MKEKNLPPLVAALLEKEKRKQGKKNVNLLETHISWVIVAGDFAYKIKKPVTLPFVDYSTLEARRAFCEAELVLNRRYAPELYLGLEPIGGTPRDPSFGKTPAIEWAVKMRRFDEECRMDHVCARGELTSEMLSDLARTVAAFHAKASPAPPGSRFGEPFQVLAPALGNFLELRTLLPEEHPLLADLERWTKTEFENQRKHFTDRKASGRIRECHGDLHLGNIVLLHGRVTPFDCIEFNEDLRWIDQASELAFTYEDLLDHLRPGLANWLISAWLAETGDFSALAVLPFYAVYRSLVRAKVAAIRGDAVEAHEYLAMAGRLSVRPQPTLTVTYGLSGSGKTTISSARLLEDPSANTVRIRSDVERKRLFGLTSGETSGGIIYTEDATEKTYSRLEELAETALAGGWSVIVDAAFLLQSRRNRFRSLASRMNAPFFILACEAPREELCRRLRERRNDASEATAAVLDEQMKWAEPLTEEERSLVISLEQSGGSCYRGRHESEA